MWQFILALERVPPGYPRRIPLELFSEETLKRIDGLEDKEGMIRTKNSVLIFHYQLYIIFEVL